MTDAARRTAAPGTYRRDIDGMRALAILSVVLYHFGIKAMSGGFVGVDVFFVISGFLITSILLRDIDAGRFSLAAFYERRARRILPALSFMLAVTTVMVFVVFLPIDLAAYGRTQITTALSASNLLFWRQSGYFDRSAELKPLLHTWSLAVEEQFYIVFPPFIWMVAKFARKRLTVVLAACVMLSFALCVVATVRWPVAAFYLPLTRAWELLLGSFLASGAVPSTQSARIRHALSLGGIALIVTSVFLMTRAMAFPGWLAAVPCLGSALIVHTSLSGGGVGNRILAWRPLVGVGLISYSLYLWHWPLLVVAHYAANRDLTPRELAAVLTTAVVIATVSWRYVERPFRGGPRAVTRRRVFQLAAAASLMMIATGATLLAGAGFPARLPANVLGYADVASEEFDVLPGCFNRTAGDVRRGNLCVIGAAGQPPSFIVWGDSHASRIGVPISDIAAARGEAGLLAAVGSCPPLADVRWPLRGCAEFNEEVLRLISRARLRTVILAGKWADYAEGVGFNHSGPAGGNVLGDDLSLRNGIEDNPAVFARALRRTVADLSRAGARVVVVGPVPEIETAVPEALAKAEWFGGPKEIGPAAAEFRQRQRHVFAVLREISVLGQVDVIYPSVASCQARCAVEQSGHSLYVDDNHLSRAGLALVKPLLEHVFDRRTAAAAGDELAGEPLPIDLRARTGGSVPGGIDGQASTIAFRTSGR